MTQEALKLALEALEVSTDWNVNARGKQLKSMQAITALRKALAEHAMRETQRLGQEIEQEPFEYWNAVEGWVKIDEVREHFDSVGCGTIYKTAGDGRVPLCLAKPEQEPVAYLTKRKIGGTESLLRADMVDRSAKNQETHDFIPLYKDPKPCPTCEALARTVMLDQTSHDTTPPQRKPLTDEEIRNLWDGHVVPVFGKNGINPIVFARAIEAAHNIKENT